MSQLGAGSVSDSAVPTLASPGAGLAQETALAEQLVLTLQRESERLVDLDAEGVMALLMEKARLVGSMTEQALARHRALSAAGYPESEEGMQQWTKRLTADSPSVKAWNGLLVLARTAKELNQTNGVLITRQMSRNQFALQSLNHTVPNTSVYGPKGQPAAVSVSRARAVS
ncbi:MAG: flagella synthesis protein FlgN [Janthinobacterium lividum]